MVLPKVVGGVKVGVLEPNMFDVVMVDVAMGNMDVVDVVFVCPNAGMRDDATVFAPKLGAAVCPKDGVEVTDANILVVLAVAPKLGTGAELKLNVAVVVLFPNGVTLADENKFLELEFPNENDCVDGAVLVTLAAVVETTI